MTAANEKWIFHGKAGLAALVIGNCADPGVKETMIKVYGPNSDQIAEKVAASLNERAHSLSPSTLESVRLALEKRIETATTEVRELAVLLPMTKTTTEFKAALAYWKREMKVAKSALDELEQRRVVCQPIEQPAEQAPHKEAEFYRLLRRILIAQKHGDYKMGEKFSQIISEDGDPATEEDFDARMERALKVMGGEL